MRHNRRLQVRYAGWMVGSIALMLTACGGSTAASNSPSASSSVAALNCTLPISSNLGQQAGFLAIPSGKYTADPGAGTSTTGMTYDRPHQRWLPVSWVQVLPDGSAYAYTREASPTQSRNEIHVVSVATRSDQVVYNQGAYHVVAYRPEGVYLDHHLNGTDASNGLWLLDPSSGSLKAYPSGQQATWGWIGGGGAWSYSVDGNRFGSNIMARMDLSTGAVESWFQVAGPQPPAPGSKSIRVIGFDGSYPLVQVYVDDHTSEIWRLTGPGQATRLPDLPLGPLSPPSSIADSHGTWLIAGDGSVYLYATGSFARVAAAPPVTNGWYIVSGTCA
jgi:hypothetical protein